MKEKKTAEKEQKKAEKQVANLKAKLALHASRHPSEDLCVEFDLRIVCFSTSRVYDLVYS